MIRNYSRLFERYLILIIFKSLGKAVTINDISVKAKSKEKVYQVLTYEGGMYLPSVLDANKEYIKEILTGSKKFIYWTQILTVKVPHIKSLSIKNVLRFAKEQIKVEVYLPTYKYNKLPNKDWLWNVVNTLANKESNQFIQERLANREKYMAMKMRLNVVAIPVIAHIFAKSKNDFYMNGRAHFLLRRPLKNTNRKIHDIEMDQNEENKNEIELYQEKISNLQKEVENYQAKNDVILQDKENSASFTSMV